MAYTETTTTSYGKRIGNSFKGIVTGFILFIVGTILLFWNEGNFVKTKKALNEGQSVVVEMNDPNKINSELNGKFVHATALATTNEILTDELFGVSEQAVALDRKVEYFQWVEKSKSESKDKVGGGKETKTTYTYERKWTDKPVNSTNFKDAAYQNKNTTLTTVESQKTLAKDVSFGAYKLPEFIITAIQGNTAVNMNLSDEKKKEWESAIQKKINNNSTSQSSYFHVDGNVAYIGQTPSDPKIGDVRVTIVKTEPNTISILC